MKVGIMQPYLFPYIGYFQLINAVDRFVVYDNIQFTKKGWFNRNRILINGKDQMFTVPIKKGSDYLDVRDRILANNYPEYIQKILRQIKNAYRKAPFFDAVFKLAKTCFSRPIENLFELNYFSLQSVIKYLEIDTELIVSSDLKINHSLKGQARVIAICDMLGAQTYINAIKGMELYSHDTFKKNGIKLNFIKANATEYSQFENNFIPWLSIIDVMMFNSKAKIKFMLQDFSFISKGYN
jgi:hypothetical protein